MLAVERLVSFESLYNMGSCCQLFLYGGVVVIAIVSYGIYNMTKVPPMPKVDRAQYWGPGEEPKTLDQSIRPFKIVFDSDMVTDLRSRLNRSRFTEPYEGIAFEYGFNHRVLKEVVEFWKTKYDFAEREKFFNQYPHFKTNIQGLDIHYIHIKPKVEKNKKVLPLILLHGWPGSVREFYGIAPLLTTPRKDSDFVFELIIPSLPGYGYSQAASKTGLNPKNIGIVMTNLMKRLGHEQFYVQGGDWGSAVGSCMATLFPDNVLGYHTNFPMANTPFAYIRMIVGSLWPSMFVEEQYIGRMYPLLSRFTSLLEESGYFHIQATKPDTVGAGIGDSPAGLAAYILEKFSTGTNIKYRNLPDGGLSQKFTYTDLIDNLMMYWVPNSAATAVRLYAEAFTKSTRAEGMDSIPTVVPTAAAKFPHEISYSTDSMLRHKYPNLVHSTNMPKGGHFAAFEEPNLLADDIVSAVKKFIEFNRNKSTK